MTIVDARMEDAGVGKKEIMGIRMWLDTADKEKDRWADDEKSPGREHRSLIGRSQRRKGNT